MSDYIYEENVNGLFYVNDDCIACDTCVDLAPEHFKLTSDHDHAFVFNQPKMASSILKCNEAVDTCPVAAIGKRNDYLDH